MPYEIETETGLVKAVVNETFENNETPSKISQILAKKLIGQLSAHFPLRGKIETIENDDIILNVGSQQGVEGSGKSIKQSGSMSQLRSFLWKKIAAWERQ